MIYKKQIFLLIIMVNALFSYSIEVINSKDLKLDLEVEVMSGYKYKVTEFPGISSFDLDKAKIELNTEINKRLDLSIGLDFAEFEDETLTSEVIKNAYAQYTFNDYFKIRAGQFKSGFGGEISLSRKPHLEKSEASKKIAPGRVRGIQLSGNKIFNHFSYKLRFANSGEYTVKGNDDGHHIGALKIDYNLKKKKDFQFKTGYSLSIGTHDYLAQSLYALYIKQISSDSMFFFFAEYMEQRFFNYYWDYSFFTSCAIRIKNIAPVIHLEFFDNIAGADGEDDKFVPGIGINFYTNDDLFSVRFDYSVEHLFSLPPTPRNDRFYNHEFKLLVEARI